MLDPVIMCRNHLLGEHEELHAFEEAILSSKSIKGYIEKNELEPCSLFERHRALVYEMHRRNWKGHTSLLKLSKFELLRRLGKKYYYHRLNKGEALKLLLNRCVECKKRYDLQQQLLKYNFRFDGIRESGVLPARVFFTNIDPDNATTRSLLLKDFSEQRVRKLQEEVLCVNA